MGKLGNGNTVHLPSRLTIAVGRLSIEQATSQQLSQLQSAFRFAYLEELCSTEQQLGLGGLLEA
jgi:hypothetical protein